MKVIKKDLIDKLAAKTKCNKSIAKTMLESLFSIISDHIAQGDKVVLPEIGVLLAVLYKEKKSGAIKDGSLFIIPSQYRVRLINSKFVKEKMQKLRAIKSMESTTLFT